jgi:protein FAM32A
MKPAFTGGSLSFKGEKKKSKKKTSQTKHALASKKKVDDAACGSLSTLETNPIIDDDLTEAERKALLKKRERDRKELEKVASKSHRERIEEFNEKLGSQTEHNDIPRVCLIFASYVDMRGCFSLNLLNVSFILIFHRLALQEMVSSLWTHEVIASTFHSSSAAYSGAQ